MLPTKFQVNWPFGSGEKGKIGGHLGFPIGTILAIFDLQTSRCFQPSFESIGLLVQKKQKIDFQDGLAAILDFQSE